MQNHNLTPRLTGDWWPGLTIPQILAKAPEDAAYSAMDLTGCIATFQVRAKPHNPVALLDLRSDGTDPQISITEPTGPIVVSGSVLALPPGLYYWELELLFPGMQPKTYLGGIVTFPNH